VNGKQKLNILGGTDENAMSPGTDIAEKKKNYIQFIRWLSHRILLKFPAVNEQ